MHAKHSETRIKLKAHMKETTKTDIGDMHTRATMEKIAENIECWDVYKKDRFSKNATKKCVICMIVNVRMYG